MPSPARRRSVAPWLILSAAVVASLLALAPPGWAQSDHSTAIRVLESGRDFRARVRAAQNLGSTNDRSVTRHLIAALRDESPGVRAAAATALGRLGDPRALAPLRARMSDSERAVRGAAQIAIRRITSTNPNRGARTARSGSSRRLGRLPTIAVIPRAQAIAWNRVRYVVVVGSMENRSNFRDATLGQLLLAEVNRNLLVLRGVAVLHDGQEPPNAAREIRRRRLPKLRLEGSLNRVVRRTRRRQLSVRSEVSLVLMDDPGRNLRASLTGAATANAPRRGARAAQERRLVHQALTGAVRSAMRGAATAIIASGRRR